MMAVNEGRTAMSSAGKNSQSAMRILGIWLACAFSASPAFALTGTVTSDIGLNLRESPRGKILGALPAGSTFEVLSRQGKWLHVRLSDGRLVYVWNPNNVNVSGAEKLTDGVAVAPLGRVEREPLPAVPVDKPVEKPVDANPVPLPAGTVGSGVVPVPEVRPAVVQSEKPLADVPIPVARPRDLGMITATGNYRLRAAPGTDQSVVATLRGGRSKLTVLKREGDWVQVRTEDGKTGWVHKGATEASACVDGSCRTQRTTRDDAADILAATEGQARGSGSGLACVRAEILKAAKHVVRTNYGNRSKSRGLCALGVRQALDRAGVNNGAGLGHAVDYHSKGVMRRKGFVNRINQYNAQNAPPGAILVFRGPLTANYLRNGRMSRPYGNYVGHVTVKGDDGRYYTDGRTVAPAVANRTLVGVYVPEDMSKMSPGIRRKCQ